MPILSDIFTPTTSQQQVTVHSGEVFAIWQHLVMRYDIRELTDIFQNFAKDIDFRALLSLGMKILDDEIIKLEDKMNSLGISMPPRPPKSINTPTNTEVLRDELMFRLLFMGVQNFLTEHVRGILASQEKSLRELFVDLERKEIGYYEKLTDYGKLKGWLFIPPAYNQIR